MILINSNPATIMTDPMMADSTYIEPIEKNIIEKIIKIEKPDAILPTMGGQTALNATLELFHSGVLTNTTLKLSELNLSLLTRQKTENYSKNV